MVNTKQLVCAAAVAALALGSARGDDARDRRAKAALALAAKPAPALAPPPRPAALDYPSGYARAAKEQSVLVVFVGCPGHPPVAGAVVSRVEAFGDVKGPAAVVGYPVGDRLYVDQTLPCPVDAEQLAQAVKTAARKIESPPNRSMPAAPRPLKWDL